MKAKIWGVRGSIPTPGESTLKYGGNTSCVQVLLSPSDEAAAGSLIVFDAGTGIRVLGNEITRQYPNGAPLDISLFLTHLHWDHIQGLPFFLPMYRDETQVRLYGPAQTNLEKLVKNQMHSDYFPITMDDEDVKAQFEFFPMGDPPVKVGGVSVRRHIVNHGPDGTTAGFRADSAEGGLVYIPDCEPYDFEAGVGKSKDPDKKKAEADLIEFLRDADTLLFDTMFTKKDYEQYQGWGHSPADYALDLAVAAGVRRLGMFHYSPSRTDEEIDLIATTLELAGQDRGVEIFASREGMEIEIGGEIR